MNRKVYNRVVASLLAWCGGFLTPTAIGALCVLGDCSFEGPHNQLSLGQGVANGAAWGVAIAAAGALLTFFLWDGELPKEEGPKR